MTGSFLTNTHCEFRIESLSFNDTSPYEGDVLIHITRKELWFWNEDKDQYVQYYLKEKQDDPT